MDVILRGVNGDLYRRLKAEAALRGWTVSKAVEEAMGFWLSSADKEMYSEADANNREYVKMKRELLKDHPGEYAVFCLGRFVGLADTLDEAGEVARRNGADRALVTKVGEVKPAGGEWLWSSLEL